MKKTKKSIKIIIFLVVIGLLVWFVGVKPKIQFMNQEKNLLDYGKRYFELNPNELPTGERVKTVTLKDLYHKSFIKKDILIPYTKTICSMDNSWVKVRRVNGEYNYYVYLECGLLKSNIDHTGPSIKLVGDSIMNINIGDTYTEPGVSSVRDKVDGNLDVKDVVVKGNVNTEKLGTYIVTYTAFDHLNNKTVAKREINVVQKIYNTIKKDLNDAKNYVGNPVNNYVRISNMIFRIYGYDDDKDVILVSDEDISNVNFTKIDKWLDYYYNNLNDFTKKIIVSKKYCNMSILDEKSVYINRCNSYTDKKKIYIPSIVDINNAEHYNESNKSYDSCFMEPYTISWTSNNKDSKNAYATRNLFWGEDGGKRYVSFPQTHNYGIRPKFTIKGDTLITGGVGTLLNPYVFGDTKVARGSSLVNTRYTGEYVKINGDLYRIIESLKDGTTKVISQSSLGSYMDDATCSASPNSDTIVYDPKNKYSVAYFINNSASKYIDTSFFTKHDIKVPIYKKDIIYKEEVETKTYNVLLSAPNMYEIFSAKPQAFNDSGSYWLINSSKANRITGAISDIGVVINEQIPKEVFFNIRVVAYLKKNITISSGKGTIDNPYILSK